MRTGVRAVSFGAALWCGCFGAILEVAHAADPEVVIIPRERPRATVKAEPLLRIDSSLVLIPVHVTNAIGATVNGLPRDSFHVYEDRVEQAISSFITEDAPVSVGFLFDTSGSMRTKVKKSAEAAAAFFRTANPEDEFFLIEFNDKARLMVPFTTDSEQVYQEIAHTRPTGRTTLMDAIHLALRQMNAARHARKAIVIISDGGDNWSRHSEREVRSALIESDVQLYAMGIFDAELTEKQPAEERNGPKLLSELTELTGGRHYPVPNIEELPAISRRIGRELRSQYLLGYYSANTAKDGKYRQVSVKLTTPNVRSLRTYYRRGYYAPAD